MQNGKVRTAANRRGSGYELGNAKDSFGATLTEWFALMGSKRNLQPYKKRAIDNGR